MRINFLQNSCSCVTVKLLSCQFVLSHSNYAFVLFMQPLSPSDVSLTQVYLPHFPKDYMGLS